MSTPQHFDIQYGDLVTLRCYGGEVSKPRRVLRVHPGTNGVLDLCTTDEWDHAVREGRGPVARHGARRHRVLSVTCE